MSNSQNPIPLPPDGSPSSPEDRASGEVDMRAATDHALPPEAPAADAKPPSGDELPLGQAARAVGSALRRQVRAGLGTAAAGIAGSASAAMSRSQALVTRSRRRSAGTENTGENPSPQPVLPGGRLGSRRARAPGTRAIRFGWRLFLWSLFLLVGGASAAVLAIWLTMRDLPLANVLPPVAEPTVSIRTADGEILTTRGAYRAPYVAFEEFPPHLIGAVLAVEDKRFFEHSGVDLRGIARALYRNIGAGGVVEGGSTVTQQLVKILYLEPERTVSRKLQEAVIATTLERQLGKERILELYLNSVYLGSGAYGMPAAAQTYYGKDVSELTLPEAAMLAASIQLPSQVNPIADLASAQNRAALVLSLMADQGRIEEANREQALAQLAVLSPEPPPNRAGSYFADWVLAEAEALQSASSQGITATATLDTGLQAATEQIVRQVMAEEGAAAGASQAAVLVMRPNGRILAMVGGLDYGESQFNRATDALRQPGSTFKVFPFMTALVMGATPDDIISDEPIEIGNWSPQNFDGRSHGLVSLREAFAKSYNQAAVRLFQEVGIANVIEVARRFGIEAELRSTPSLALGASEVTLLDMTEAFAALALGRTPVKATGIDTLRFGEDGDVLGITRVDARQQTRLSRTHGPMLQLLRSVVEEGTGRSAAIPGVEIFGKTGTSQESRDAWFIGFARSEGYVIGVWVGNDDNSPMDRVTGGGIPAEIFRRVMTAAISSQPSEPDQSVAQPARTVEGPQCDIRACSAAYRSFRASDCTYQPYEGPREICTR